MPEFSRKNMPQVDTQNLGKAMDMVSDKAKITKGTISAGKLKKSQKELHQDKVEGIAKKFTSPGKFKPLVISKDNHIVDGHHRWGAAIYKWGEDVKIPIIRIHLPIVQAIKLYKEIALKLNQPVKETIKKVGDKYAVYPKRGGDRLGTHDTKSDAEKQLAAIEISKHKNEDITIPINVGDTVLGGKFKNKRIVVKSIEKNEKGDITINGKPLLKFRLVTEGTDNLEMLQLMNKAMKAFPQSPKQKELIKKLNVLRIKNGMKPLGENVINEQKYYVTIQRPGLKPHLDRKSDVKAGKILDEPKVFNSIADARAHIQSYKRFNRMHGFKGITFWVSDLKMNKIDESTINEIPMGDLEKIDTFADKQLNPLDIVLTGRHFFDRLNDPRNGKEISNAELIGFFKRLSKKKKEFVEFLQTYNTLVATDDKTNINIPFMKQSNKAIAKTIMRKKDFKTPDKKLDI
jgi:hypothetical protein